MSAKPLSSNAWPADPSDAISGQPGFESVRIYRVGDSVPDSGLSLGAIVLDTVAQEVPVALVFNGVSHAVMLASPTDLEDFARGFAVTEGIVDSYAQIYDVVVQSASPSIIRSENAQDNNAQADSTRVGLEGYEVQVEIASAAFARLKEKRRNLTGRTGCGLCGTESLEQVFRPLPRVPAHKRTAVDASVIDRALAALPQFQAMQHLTGGTHAAAWFSPQGELLLLREDVGRHNALDKLIGAGLGAKANAFEIEFGCGFVLVTSRASMEMVQKTLAAGFGMLVAVSASTALAIDLAKRQGLTLVGFARPGRCSIYHAPAGVQDDTRI